MKVLFVLTDSKYLYGASKSLRGLLDGLDDSFEYDLVLGKSFTQNTPAKIARTDFGGKMGNLYYMWVPRYRCIDYTVTGIVAELSHFVNNLLAFVFRYRIYNLIKKVEYDYIHLNSTVLFPLIESGHKYILHNRDIIREDYWLSKLLIQKLRKVAGVINIDVATKNGLSKYIDGNRNCITLANPIDMCNVHKYDPKECAEELGIDMDHKQTVFAMIGQITKEKGSEFVIDGFLNAGLSDAILLIAGNNETIYAKKMIEKYALNKNVYFVGELKEVAIVYRVADCIIRGEDRFAVGRTHVEGLFSGLCILIPGNNDNIDDIYNGREYKEKVVFYEPRNKSALIDKLKIIGSIDWNERQYTSNREEYSEKYRKYIELVV